MLRIGFVLTPGFQMMSLAAASAFEFANLVAGEKVYEMEILSETGGLLSNSLGIPIETHKLRLSGMTR